MRVRRCTAKILYESMPIAGSKIEDRLRAGARPDLPLHELSPEDFHRLALNVLHRAPEYASARNHGSSGADGGVDLVADFVGGRDSRRPPAGPVAATAVQVKRVKAFTATSARAELTRLERSGAGARYDRYLLITSAVPSAPAMILLREGCAQLGIGEVDAWDRSTLTARLLEHDDLLTYFLGIQDPAAWLHRASTNEGLLTVRELLAEGRSIVLYVGEQAGLKISFDDAWESSGALALVRELVRDAVVSSVVSPFLDLSLALGDLLPLKEDDAPPKSRALWQPSGWVSGDSLARALAAAEGRAGMAPILLALGLSAAEYAHLVASGSVIRSAVPPGGLVLTDTDLPPATGITTHRTAALLSFVVTFTAGDRAVFSTERLDFDAAYAPAEILQGRPVEPGVVASGSWESALWPDLRDALGTLEIVGPVTIREIPGSGKTALAYYLAHRLAPGASFYLDLQSLPDGAADLRRLLAWVEERHAKAVLIVDNVQAHKEAVEELTLALHNRSRHRVQVILVETAPYRDLDLFGGEIQQTALRSPWWHSRRLALGEWARTALPSLTETQISRAVEGARNAWHFFFLLRGGTESLESELRQARSDDFGDVIWFVIAATHVFRRGTASVRELHCLLDELELWPLSVGAGDRGRWLLDGLARLLTARRIVTTPVGFVCRHHLEAVGVVRLCFERDAWLTPSTFRAAAIALFKEEVKPVEVPPQLRDPSGLTKAIVYPFVDSYVDPALTRQRELEQAVPYDDELQRHVEGAWSAVLALVEEWPPHPLYWLFNRAYFSSSFLRFSPFKGLTKLAALETMSGGADAIDVALSIKGLLGMESHNAAQTRLKLRYLSAAALPAIRRLRALAEHEGDDEQVEEMSKQERELTERLEQLADNDFSLLVDTLMVQQEHPPAQGWEPAGWREHLLSLSRAWLAHHAALFESATQAVDTSRIVHAMHDMPAANRVFLLAHLWLLSPDLGRKIHAEIPEQWRRDLSESVRHIRREGGAFHLAHDDGALAVLVADIARVDQGLSAWLQTEEAGKVGTGVRALEAMPPVEQQAPSLRTDLQRHDLA